MELVEKRKFSDKKRKELADKGHALPDGSFPIENTTDLHNAIQSIGRASDYSKAKAHIISRAKALNATKLLPEDWKINKFIDDVKEAFKKAIGTSSSVDQERDERSVENYVRQSANTNVNNEPDDYTIGGNTMSNTTEPDPQGDIAINKVVDGETAPAGNQSVSDAPEGPTPTEETFASSATSAVAPSKTDEVSTPDTVTIAKGEKCPTCGSIAKGDETEEAAAIEKSATCSDCGKELSLCDCMGKAVDEKETAAEDAKETPADEKAEMKKSLWGGAFAPRK